MQFLSDDVLFREFPARAVALFRIVVGGAGTVVAIATGRTLLRLAAPETVTTPVFAVAPAVRPSAAIALATVWIVAAALLTVGARTRLASAITVGCALLAMLWDQQVTSNHLTLLVVLTALLGAAGAGAALSVDARLGRGRPTVPFWPVLLLRTQVSTMYLFTALAKMNPEFLRGDVLEQQVPMARWLAGLAGDGVLPAMAISTVLVELLLAVGLWFRPSRLVAATAGIVLHLGIVVAIPGLLHELVPFGIVAMSSYVLFLADDLGQGWLTASRPPRD